jgi:hypothetical protein
MLGPFAKAISMVFGSKTEHKREDKLDMGSECHNLSVNQHKLGFLSRSFIVFNGTSMTPDDIEKWMALTLQGQRRYTDK